MMKKVLILPAFLFFVISVFAADIESPGSFKFSINEANWDVVELQKKHVKGEEISYESFFRLKLDPSYQIHTFMMTPPIEETDKNTEEPDKHKLPATPDAFEKWLKMAMKESPAQMSISQRNNKNGFFYWKVEGRKEEKVMGGHFGIYRDSNVLFLLIHIYDEKQTDDPLPYDSEEFDMQFEEVLNTMEISGNPFQASDEEPAEENDPDHSPATPGAEVPKLEESPADEKKK